MEEAGSSKDLRVQCKLLFIAWFDAVTLHPVTVRDRECGWVSKAKHWSWAPPRVRNLWEELCVSNIVGVHLCPGLQAFPGRWLKPTTLPHLRKVSQVQREGLSTCAGILSPLAGIRSREGQEEQGLQTCAPGTGRSRRLRFFWSLVLGLFSSFDYSLTYNTWMIIN